MGEPLCLIVLIVDDEPAIRGYLSVLLQQRGMQSVAAGNAVEALRILQKLGDEIDLVVTDIQMPGEMDGVDLAYSVKNQFSSIPVILISADEERAVTDFPFVRKPFTAEAMLNAIEKAMTKTRAGGAR